MKEIGGTIARVSEIAASISTAVEQQGAATNEIARNVQQAAQGSTQLATNITDVSRGADARLGVGRGAFVGAAPVERKPKAEGGDKRFLATVRAA